MVPSSAATPRASPCAPTALTLDFSLVWFGIALALVAAVFLAYHSAPALARMGREASRSPAECASQEAAAAVCASSPSCRSPPRSCSSPAPACSCAPSTCSSRPARPSTPPTFSPSIFPSCPMEERPSRCVTSIGQCTARRSQPCPECEHVATGFSVPWRDDQGLNISFAFAAQGATRKNGQDDLRAKFRSVSPGLLRNHGGSHR